MASPHNYNLRMRNTPQKDELTPVKQGAPAGVLGGSGTPRTPRTPRCMDRIKTAMGEPVFKTPMSFSPRVVLSESGGKVVKPSPSRHEIWKDQLGFDESDPCPDDVSFSSDDDDEDKENAPLGVATGDDVDGADRGGASSDGGGVVATKQPACTRIEYQALLRELSERNSQRDELVLKLKVQTEKNRQYQQRLEKDEVNKRQQIKILGKTHEMALLEKENLIRNLESIIDENESQITELHDALKGGKCGDPSRSPGLHRLVRQVEDVQAKNSELLQRALGAEHQCEQLQGEVRQLQLGQGEEDRERNELQEELIRLRSAKGNGSTDDQKLVHKLEKENDQLRSKLHSVQLQLSAVKCDLGRDNPAAQQQLAQEMQANLHALQEENSALRSRSESLAKELKERNTSNAAELSRLGDENLALARELRALKSELVGMQAKSPEVVHKIKTVEVESTALQKQCEQLRTQLHSEQERSRQLQASCEQLRSEQQAAESRVAGSQTNLAKITNERDLVRSQLDSVRSELNSMRSGLDTKQSDFASLQTEVNSLRTELEQKRSECDKLNSQLCVNRSEFDTIRSERDSVANELKSAETGRRSIDADLTRVRQELDAQIRTLRAENTALNSQLEIANSTHKTVTSELDKCVSDNKGLVEDKQRLTQSLKELEAQMVEARQHVSQKDADLDVMLKETGILQDELDKHQQQLQLRDTQLCESEAKAAQLQTELEQYGEEVTQLQLQMEAEIEQLKEQQEIRVQKLQKEHKALVHDMKQRLSGMTRVLNDIVPSFKTLQKDYGELRTLCLALPNVFKTNVDLAISQIVAGVEEVNRHNKELIAKYRREMALRKKYHNQLVELKGNIRVYCRVRPRIREDGQGPSARGIVSCDTEDDGLIQVQHKGRVQSFDLDRVFDEGYSQQQVYDEVTALVTCCVDGYNVCIFAYGQTGSGKTYTMEGTMEDPGINQRALAQLFHEASERAHAVHYSIHVSVLEIYNENIRDLLSAEPTRSLEVKMNLEEGGVHVPGLTYIHVTSVAEVNEVFALGHKNRVTAATNMNEYSSRSHALLRVRVVGTNLASGNKTIGVLSLVDLAGSERVSKSGADGARLKEAQSINKSLSSLGDVMHALRTHQGFVPYRNSKLTYLLQDSLGGDSKTLMITQLSPVERNVGETLASLNFAQRVRTVELGQATKKTVTSEIAELKERLAQYEDTTYSSPGTKAGASKMSPPNKVQRQK